MMGSHNYLAASKTRFLAVTAVLCLAGCVNAQDFARKVDFVQTAAPAKKLIPELAKASGIDLKVAPTVANDILLVDVHQAPIGKLMGKIADVLDAEWEKKDSAYTLTRPDALLQIRKAEILAENAELIAKALAPWKKRAQDLPDWDASTSDDLARRIAQLGPASLHGPPTDPQNSLGALAGQTPMQRLLTRVAASFDPKELAAIPLTETRIFATDSTHMELPLPGSAKQALGLYESEQALWETSCQRLVPAHTVPAFALNLPAPAKWQPKQPFRLLFRVRNLDPNDFDCTVTVAGAQGLRANYTTASFSSPQRQPQKPMLAGGETEIRLTPESQEFRDLLSTNTWDPAQLHPSEDLVAALLHPEDRDPLSYFASEYLEGMAKASGKDLVANLTDDMLFSLADSGGKKPATAAAVLTQCLSAASVTLGDGYISVKPIDGPLQRALTVDRASLRDYLRSTTRAGRQNLASDMAYAIHIEAPLPEITLGPILLEYLLPAPNLTGVQNPWDWIRFYALLDASQITAMKSDTGLRVGSLSPAQFHALHHAIFDQDLAPGLANPPNNPNKPLWLTVASEPPELMPDDVPSDSFLKEHDLTDQVALREAHTGSNGGLYASESLDAQALASYVFNATHQDDPRWNRDQFDQPETTRFYFGTRSTIDLTLQVTPLANFEAKLADYKFDGSGPRAWDQLPVDFVEQVKKAIQQLTDSAKNSKAHPTRQGHDIPPR